MGAAFSTAKAEEKNARKDTNAIERIRNSMQAPLGGRGNYERFSAKYKGFQWEGPNTIGRSDAVTEGGNASLSHPNDDEH